MACLPSQFWRQARKKYHSRKVSSLHDYPHRLKGHGVGIARNIRAEAAKAISFIKFILSPIFACGSLTAQKLCIIKATGTRKTTIMIAPMYGWYPSKMLKLPNRSKSPLPPTANVGAGTPLDAA